MKQRVIPQNREGRVMELKRLMTTKMNEMIPTEFKDFNELHKYVTKLMQRDVWTHEFAFPELLYQEIMSGKEGNPFGESLVRATELTKGKKTLIVSPSEEEGLPLGFKVVGRIDLSKKKKE